MLPLWQTWMQAELPARHGHALANVFADLPDVQEVIIDGTERAAMSVDAHHQLIQAEIIELGNCGHGCPQLLSFWATRPPVSPVGTRFRWCSKRNACPRVATQVRCSRMGKVRRSGYDLEWFIGDHVRATFLCTMRRDGRLAVWTWIGWSALRAGCRTRSWLSSPKI